MSEKKRTIVTTVETHEVWVVRRPVPELPDELVTVTTQETAATDAAALSPELPNGSETSTEQS